MKVDCEILEHMHLDPGYALLSAQNCIICLEMFKMLDIHQGETLNGKKSTRHLHLNRKCSSCTLNLSADVQFSYFLRNITNLNPKELEIIFHLLDVDHSGEIEFDEFYLFFCILVANKVHSLPNFKSIVIVYKTSSAIYKSLQLFRIPMKRNSSIDTPVASFSL